MVKAATTAATPARFPGFGKIAFFFSIAEVEAERAAAEKKGMA
jgi:hypothetical protein